VRQFRILCALVVAIFAALSLSIALENPGSSANAQSHTPSSTAAASATSTSTSTAATTSVMSPSASNGIAPTIVATNIGVRSLVAAPPSAEQISKSAPTPASSATAQKLLVTSVDKPDRVFSLIAPAASTNSVAAAALTKSLVAIAGIGEVGSIGDGGAATSAQLDLNTSEITARSGVAVASDGTIYIADSGNATIRMIAGPNSSEPGIIRSVAGRWAPAQSVELSQPMGLALDRAGNLYIADFGANSIDVLYGSASPKAGHLETIAHMVAPGNVAVTLDGAYVFASSPQTGIILAINTQTRAIRTPEINPAAFFTAAAQSSTSARITPTGISVDGGGNLFIAYSDPGAASDEILRLDAFSGKVTLAARGLSSPGDISFDAKGNLYVANQGMRNLVRFNDLGVAALGVTLTAPVGDCSDSDTIFCDQLIGGLSPTQAYELTNNTPNQLSDVTASFLSGNSGDFTISNSSCTTLLAANSSCAFNVAFSPTANAAPFETNDGTACVSSATANSRCSVLTVNYSGATSPLLAAATGIADDFQIGCVTSMTTSCVDVPPDSVFDQATITQGNFVTFQLQIVPDSTFSGPVTLVCPSDLPVGPTGSVGSPTTCGLSLGTTVTEPLQNMLTVNVVPGTPLAFNMTIQTTDMRGLQTTPPTSTTPAAGAKKLSLGALLLGKSNGSGGPNSGNRRNADSAAPAVQSLSPVRLLLIVLACALVVFVSTKHQSLIRRHPGFALAVFAALLITIAGCGGSSKSKGTIPYTPTGTYKLTVQGSAQNAARGYTCTLIVATGQ
jgi:sugar lactone lactonase YvrE